MKRSTVQCFDEIVAGNLIEFCISADWLQIHVVNDADFANKNTVNYRVQRSGQTKVFGDVYDISTIQGKHIASYATNANSCILEKGHGILKFANDVLYRKKDLRTFVCAFLDELHFRFVGITRLDIAFDFHKFHNNRDPENFIKSFLRGDILKKISTQFRVAGVHKKQNEFNWIYFGSHASDVSCKLYNKSGEQLKERKPWIWERWKKESYLDTKKTIWRLEFTLNATLAKFYNSFIEVPFHSLEMLDYLPGLFCGLFQYYFRFVKNDRHQSRKDRMKEITLLKFVSDIMPLQIKRPAKTENLTSTRTQKILINQLLIHHNELREFDQDFEIASMEMIKKIVDRYNLEDWARSKGIPFYSKEFIYPHPPPAYKDYSNDFQTFKKLNDE